MPEAEYLVYKQQQEAEELKKIQMDERTVDAVGTGEQQPEVDHGMKQEHSFTGYHKMEAWRKANNNGYFEYKLATGGATDLSLLVRYWGDERPNTNFDILIDGQLLTNESSDNIVNAIPIRDFINKEYSIPTDLLKDKQFITVRFQGQPDSATNAVYYLRLLNQSK